MCTQDGSPLSMVKKKIIQMCNGNPKGIKFQFHHRQTLLKEWHEN